MHQLCCGCAVLICQPPAAIMCGGTACSGRSTVAWDPSSPGWVTQLWVGVCMCSPVDEVQWRSTALLLQQAWRLLWQCMALMPEAGMRHLAGDRVWVCLSRVQQTNSTQRVPCLFPAAWPLGGMAGLLCRSCQVVELAPEVSALSGRKGCPKL